MKLMPAGIQLDLWRRTRGQPWRLLAWIGGVLLVLLAPSMPGQAARFTTIPQDSIGVPMLLNDGFECASGINSLDAPQGGQMPIPAGWSVAFLAGTPWLSSTSVQYNAGSCGGGAHVEKIEGSDSLAIFAHDLEWTEKPGKPFDVAVYQQVEVKKDTAYSLSAWMLSLCGGSSVPNDCPDGVYMAKMLGIDPTGGTDPLASTVVWTENRQNFVENGQRVGWTNLRLAAVAKSETITVFGRISSPFQWHGNHAFIDAFSLVEAPSAELLPLPNQIDRDHVEIRWTGRQSQHIETIPNGSYQLRFDLEYRVGEKGGWQSWTSGVAAKQTTFWASSADVPHYFRVRARSEQQEGGSGAWPNHRYPGAWSKPLSVTFLHAAPKYEAFLPKIQR